MTMWTSFSPPEICWQALSRLHRRTNDLACGMTTAISPDTVTASLPPATTNPKLDLLTAFGLFSGEVVRVAGGLLVVLLLLGLLWPLCVILSNGDLQTSLLVATGASFAAVWVRTGFSIASSTGASDQGFRPCRVGMNWMLWGLLTCIFPTNTFGPTAIWQCVLVVSILVCELFGFRVGCWLKSRGMWSTMRLPTKRQLRRHLALTFIGVIVFWPIYIITLGQLWHYAHAAVFLDRPLPGGHFHTLENESFAWDDQLGKVLLVNYWTDESDIAALERLHAKYRKHDDFVLISICADVESATELKDRFDPLWPLVVDADGKPKQLFMDLSLVADRDGQIVAMDTFMCVLRSEALYSSIDRELERILAENK